MDRPATEGTGDRQRDWLERPWARTFDLISEAYGWTDEQIWDLTIARLRQVRDVIWSRKNEDERHRVELEEAKVRAIVGAVHGAAGNKAGVRAAAKFQLFKRTRTETPRTRDVMQTFRPDPNLPVFSEDEIEAERQRLIAAGKL